MQFQPKKHQTICNSPTALPPDVRRGVPRRSYSPSLWATPLGRTLTLQGGTSPTEGLRAESKVNQTARQATPHIRRQRRHGYRLDFLISVPVVLFLLPFLSYSELRAQTTNVQITVSSVSPPLVRTEGKRDVAARVWSFRNAYASLLGLGERITNLTLTDSEGLDVPVRKLASGEYEASRNAVGWKCEISLERPANAADAAFVSWLAGDRGFLMLGDLLPRHVDEKSLHESELLVRLNLPEKWNAYTSESARKNGAFAIKDADDAVFFIGRELRERHESIGPLDCGLVTEGTWAFSDQDILSLVVRILKEYSNRVGARPETQVTVLLSHFPASVGAERWSAETRGATVTLLSGESPSKIAGLSQLSTPLTHELFHLWVPNGLRLGGDYDWFYEGFTLYQALVVAQRLGFLTFQDYLNALSRAYDMYASTSDVRKLSLIDASLRRWTRPTALVYQKGMLVAFLYDLSLRQLTNGKRSIDDIYRALFRNSTRTGARMDGNQVVLGLLKAEEKLPDFVHKYIEGADEIDLATMIAPFGLKVERFGAKTRISASEKLSSRQRDLLRAFGYNTETRRDGRRAS